MNYTIWMDHNFDGWHPTDADTIEECFGHMHAVGHTGAYRITRPVAVAFMDVEDLY